MTEPIRDEYVEPALDLPAHLEADELFLTEAVDRIETVTVDPTFTRDILDMAEFRGTIEREGGRIRHNRGSMSVRSESQVVQREGNFDCRRCGASILTDHFVRFDPGESGSLGSSCMRKAFGRE